MCMEDVRIGRRTRTFTRVVNVGSATWVQVAKQDPNRYAISMVARANVGHIITCWVGEALAAATSTGNNQSTEYLYDLQQHGDMVTQPFYAWQSAGNMQVWVTEVVLAEE